MPSTGISRSSSSVGKAGAPTSYTEAGPPESTNPFGALSRIVSIAVVAGSSSAKTPHSRIRRAISCEYWPPKSRTSTSSEAWAGAVEAPASVVGDSNTGRDRCAPVGAHPHRLLVLQLLALAHQGRRDHHLGPLEGADVLVAAGGHRGLQGPHQVEGAVVLLGRAEEDFLQGPVLLGGDAGAARQRGMEGRHPPVVTAAGRLLGAGQRRADHHRVGPAGNRLGDVAAGAHAAVGDHIDVLTGLEHVLGARRRDIGDRGRLWHAD